MAVDDLYLENIDEFINDENKIVTYKWLSLTLKVHVNIAKQMLYTFVKTHRENKENDDLTVTYFVAGVNKRDTGELVFQCCVVPEEKLSQYKCSLSVVTSCHVYSVQKVKLKDSNALYITDFDIMKDNIFEFNKYSSIQNPRAEIRSEDDLDLLAMQTIQTDSKPEREAKTTNGDSAPSSRVATAKEKPKGAIASMFANAQKKKDAKPEMKDEKLEVKQENKPSEKASKPADKKQGGVMSLFKKQTDKSAEKTDYSGKEVNKKEESSSSLKEQKTDHDSKEVIKKEELPPRLKEKKTDHDSREVIRKEELPPKMKELSPSIKTSRKTQRIESDDEDSRSSKKKRRRIKQDLFDSSSEEFEIEEDSPVPSPVKEPSPKPESPTPEEVEVDEEEEKEKKEEKIITRSSSKDEREEKVKAGEKRRVRRKKQVKKTFMDKDGFLVTEKVWESESTDASEVEEPVKKPPAPAKSSSPQKKPSPKKKGSPSKGAGSLQTSLMSFFKKK